MFCQVLPVFLFLFFVCCQLCELKCAAQNEQLSGNINENTFSKFLFPESEKLKEAIKQANTVGKENEITVTLIDSVFIAAANDVVVALAEVDYSVNNNNKCILLEKVIETSKEKWSDNVVANSNDWKTQLVTKNDNNIKEKAKFKSSALVANGDKIYYFSVNNTTFDNGVVVSEFPENPQWHITVVVGTVVNRKEEKISWDLLDSTALSNDIKLNEKLKIDSAKISPAVSFVIRDNIVFAIQGEAKEQRDGKYVTVFFYWYNQKLELYHAEPTGNCHSSLFLWEKQIVMTPSVCESESNQKMMVFDIEKKQFNNSDKPIARLQGFLKDKKTFVTTKINNTKDVLLFTQQSKTNGKSNVDLWVTDGNRTAKVDTIISGSKSNFDLSMLHTNKELFVLYNNYETISSGRNNEKSTYNLQRLPDQLDKIKLILNAWKNTDDKIKTFFKETATTDTSSFTNALVGFLSSDSQNNEQWKDEYFYENATVTNGTKDSGGFKFSGAKAGAKWQVRKENKEDEPYNFAAFGFTLVATVKIDKDANEKGNSILGVGLGGTEKKTIGLWCSKGVWGVGDGKNTAAEVAKVTTETCVPEEKYQVVLTMKDKKISVYIDGKLVEKLPNTSTEIQKEEKAITHFYFGINDAEQKTQVTIESHVTVTNVLLYNRPFEEREVKNLKECPKTLKINRNPNEAKGNTEKGIPDNEEEKTPSPSRTGDGGVGGGVRVFSLLLAVLCVSAPLLHL